MSNSNDELFGDRAPVRVRRDDAPVRKRPRKETTAVRAEQLEKLLRRIAGLHEGRFTIIITISADGLRDWSVIEAGKVEGEHS